MSHPLFTRRQVLRAGAGLAACALLPRGLHGQGSRGPRVFDVRDFGAVGDGVTLDTIAFQKAIDAATATDGAAQVLVRGGRKYLLGSVQLKSGVDFHLADDAELLASADPRDYVGRALFTALQARGLRISGTGSLNGRAPEFMASRNEADEIWRPKEFRPRLMVLTGCEDLEVRDVTFRQAAQWTLHLAGCRRVRVDRVKIRNQLDIPNCDGIDPDHCRDVEINRCDIACGDDAIVVKATKEGAAFGGSENIVVQDCVIETQDSGLKIGTETVADIRRVRFERCEIKTSCRACTIQLRDSGDVSDIEFRDIRFVARYHSAPWWGRGEAISFTAVPRTPETKLGTISNVRVVDVIGRAENSVRISGFPQSRIRDVRLDRVAVTLDRWTKYPGGEWDNRPTTAGPGIERHPTSAIHIRHADNISLNDCRVAWGQNRPDYFTHALEAEDVTDLLHPGFQGEAAHPERDAAVVIR